MGALKIDCYCNEKQMEEIVRMVSGHIGDSDKGDIADFDDVVGDVRVCVEFDTYLDGISLKVSEVLDSDWDLLYEDTAVLTSRLRNVVDEYNKSNREIACQAHHIVQDRWRDR